MGTYFREGLCLPTHNQVILFSSSLLVRFMSLPVMLTFIVVIALEIVVPLTLGYLIVKRFGLRWMIFLYGALFFILAQIIHIPLLYLIQPGYTRWLISNTSDPALVLAGLAIFLGLMAGVIEELIRYLAFSRFFPKKSLALTRERTLLFGAGWGGIESIFVALALLTTFISYIIITSGSLESLLMSANITDPVQLAALDVLKNLTPGDIVPGLVERIMTLIIQIAFTFIVFLAVLKEHWIFLLAAIAWHAALDAIVVFTAPAYGIWPTEAFIAGNAVLGLAIINWVWHSAGKAQSIDSRNTP
jgi:uncharacterized membrane protein YhfC